MSKLPTEAKARKAVPLATGVLDYFPGALAAVAEVSRIGNDQHNPGQPLHWDKMKSMDHADSLMRHLSERGTLDSDGVRHSAKVAWRALALLQTEIDAEAARWEKVLNGIEVVSHQEIPLTMPEEWKKAHCSEPKATRGEVYEVINNERSYQNHRWGTDPTALGNYMVYMQTYLNRAFLDLTTGPSQEAALEELRKVVALGVAAMEEHGVVPRKVWKTNKL